MSCSSDLKAVAATHTVSSDSTRVASVANAARREIVTADAAGGLKLWSLRLPAATGAEPAPLSATKGVLIRRISGKPVRVPTSSGL